MNIIELYFGSLKLTEKFERIIIGGGDTILKFGCPPSTVGWRSNLVLNGCGPFRVGIKKFAISYSLELQGCSCCKVITELAYSMKQVKVSRLCDGYNDSKDISPTDKVYQF